MTPDARITDTVARAQLAQFRKAGHSLRSIAEAIDVDEHIINYLAYGTPPQRDRRDEPRTIRADVAKRLTQLDPNRLAPRPAPSRGSCRRLRALVAIGYTQNALADHLGVSVATVNRWVSNDAPTMHPDTANAITALFNRLEARPLTGPRASRPRLHAARRGWAPPFAWTDPDHDPEPHGALNVTPPPINRKAQSHVHHSR